MKVGIISKEDHAKSHAAALEQAGFLPVMLGSSPSEIPPTVPIVVCRTLSCSHGGMDTALAWSRAGKGRLIVENGVKTIVNKALRIRSEVVEDTPPENEAVAPVRMSYEDLQEAAQVLADARPDDTYEVLVSVLHRMYPNEEISLLRAVAASVRAPAVPEPTLSEPVELPVVEVTASVTPAPETLPMPVEPAPATPPATSTANAKVYPKRFAARMTEADVNTRMEKAWEVRGIMTDAEAAAVGKWASKGAVGRVPHKDYLAKFARNPLGFAGVLLLCAEKPLAQRDFVRAYAAVTGKQYLAVMADIAAWSLDMKLRVATDAIPKKRRANTNHVEGTPPVSVEPVIPVEPPALNPDPIEETPVPTLPPATSTENATLDMLKALSASLDALLVKVGEIDGRVGDLTARIEGMSHSPATNLSAANSMEDALVGLANKGLEVVVRPSR